MEHRSYWLELCSPADLRPKPFALAGVTLGRLRGDDHPLARELWRDVGRGFWVEREDWPPERWRLHLDDPATWFGIARLGPEPLGSFELTREGDAVRVEGFGLLPRWRGRGLGAGLLSAASRQAFALGAHRIWLQTATDDHPHALPNYLARGYRIFREAPLTTPLRAR